MLGCCGSYPGPGRACSGYLVRSETTTLWLDAGSGTLANLQRHVGLHDVDAIVLSHRHDDHCADVRLFATATKHYVHRDPVPTYAPVDLVASLVASDAHLAVTAVEDGDELALGDLRLRFSATDHSVPTLAVRVDGGGKALGYSADSGPGWSLAALGPGLDLALCEATFLQDDEGKAPHMSARQAGLSGREAGVARLVLTHLAPGIDPARSRAEGAEAFGNDVTVCRDHDEFVL